MGVNHYSGPMPPRPKVSPSPQTPPRRVSNDSGCSVSRDTEDDSRDVFEAICGDDIQETSYDGDCS